MRTKPRRWLRRRCGGWGGMGFCRVWRDGTWEDSFLGGCAMGGMGRWVVFLGLQRGGVLRARGIPVRHGKNLRLMRGLLRPRGSPSPLAVLARDFVNKLNEKRRKKGGKGRATWGLLRPRILPFLASRVAQPIDRCCAAVLPRRRLRRRLPLRRRGFAARQHVAAVSATTARSRDPEGELQVHSGGLGEWPAADGRSCFVRCGVLYGAMRHVVRRGESRPAQSGTVRGIRSILATSGGLPMRGHCRMHRPRDTIN